MVNEILRGLAVLGLAAFMPFSAWTSHRIWSDRRNECDRRTLRALGIDPDAMSCELDRRYTRMSFVLPLLFATLLALFGSTYLLFGHHLVDVVNPDLLLGFRSEPVSESSTTATAEAAREVGFSLSAMIFAFASAYIWSCRNVVRRLVSGDLNPTVYYGAGLRFVFAPLVALVLRYTAIGELNDGALLPAAAFLTGIFPEEALHWIKRKVSVFSRDQDARLSLEKIQGMSAWHKARLAEAGIDDAQNLANRDLVDLLLETPFDARQLLDWIVQAKLFAHVRDDIDALRAQGVRTALDLIRDGAAESLDKLAVDSSVSLNKLETVAAELAADPALGQLAKYRRRLA